MTLIKQIKNKEVFLEQETLQSRFASSQFGVELSALDLWGSSFSMC